MSERPDTTVMTFTDGYGRKVERTIKHTLDTRDYLGTPGYPWLLLAANQDLSVSDLVRFLDMEAEKTPGVARTPTWVHVRRRLFRPSAIKAGQRPLHDPDRRHVQAIRIMANNPTLSARALVKLLQEHGIKRGKDWVWQHRCDGLKTG